MGHKDSGDVRWLRSRADLTRVRVYVSSLRWPQCLPLWSERRSHCRLPSAGLGHRRKDGRPRWLLLGPSLLHEPPEAELKTRGPDAGWGLRAKGHLLATGTWRFRKARRAPLVIQSASIRDLPCTTVLCQGLVWECGQQRPAVPAWRGDLGLGTVILWPVPPAWGPEGDQSSALLGLLRDDSQRSSAARPARLRALCSRPHTGTESNVSCSFMLTIGFSRTPAAGQLSEACSGPLITLGTCRSSPAVPSREMDVRQSGQSWGFAGTRSWRPGDLQEPVFRGEGVRPCPVVAPGSTGPPS